MLVEAITVGLHPLKDSTFSTCSYCWSAVLVSIACSDLKLVNGMDEYWMFAWNHHITCSASVTHSSSLQPVKLW